MEQRDSSHSQGRITVVGFGPGHPLDRTRRAEAAISASEVVVGYAPYLKRIQDLTDGKELLGTGMKQEVERARAALDQARNGKRVAVVSSGDAGIYGMAGLMLELVAAEAPGITVEIIPGVTAACAAASLMGAPLMLDYATISLSNLLVQWERIRERLAAAIKADFVVALYNPRSHTRTEPFAEALAIARACRQPSTPVGIATALGSAEQDILLTTLGELKEDDVTMQSIVLIGNSACRMENGWFINPRGYKL